ncbi:MAG: hypothetical protein NVSMB6_23030 [Burkholderiaceae bacterium]
MLLSAYVAIVNADDQAIVGGVASDLALLRPALEAAGGRMHRLPVSVASHTPMMHAAVGPLRQCLEQMYVVPPAIRVLEGISGDAIIDLSSAIRALTGQMVQTVQWAACMDALHESGITACLELAPGSSLSRMLQARHPHIACRSAADFRSIGGILQWIGRMD